MKRYSFAASLALTVLAVLGLAGPAAAGEQGLFKGSVQAVETYIVQFPPVVQFPTLLVDSTGTGVATHLGRFTVTYKFTVNLLNGAGIGSASFTAANGDSIFTSSLGQGNATTTPNINRVVEAHTITGGTGRFAGATGSFTLIRLVNTITGVTAGSFRGTISSPRCSQSLKQRLTSQLRTSIAGDQQNQAAGEVLTAKQAPHRPGTAQVM